MGKTKFLYLIATLLSVAMCLSGCAQLRDKFIRQRKTDAHKRAGYQPVRAYDVRPTLDMYATRYIYWKSWHDELISVLDDSNHKKKVVAIREAISNLFSMQRMLEDDKAEELQACIDRLAVLQDTIDHARLTGANVIRMRRELEVVGRQIIREFSHTKMSGHIRAEFAK